MIKGGISIKGSYHDINQDYFISESYKEGQIMVLSDGMGSKKLSQYGSKFICESVYSVINNYNLDINLFSFKDILYSCHKEWIKRLRKNEYDISQCYATLLVVVVMKNKIKAARLGDGFLSIYVDNEIYCLFDKKDDYFANETDCIRENFDRDKIEVIELEYDKFKGAIACSDGIEVGTMQEKDLQDFTKEFIEEYSINDEKYIIEDVKNWLKDWTGSDDKTLAFVMEGGN